VSTGNRGIHSLKRLLAKQAISRREFMVVLIITMAGCANQAVGLTPVQVRDYEGANLSNIDDLRENSIHGPQTVDKDKYMLDVKGLVRQPKSYTYDELIGRQSYKKVVRMECVEGWGATVLWQGLLVKDLLQDVSPDSAARTVIFRAVDGYSTSFPIEYLTGNDILMAHKMNDVTVPPKRGFPFHLVADDKWGYKWIKWIKSIEISSDENFAGFWESRGYSNSGDLDEPFFDLVRDKGSSTGPG
jgi:DMSO/TMAO reductase YedYZ molybdopterin-dependent catalytic subunit